MKKLLTILLVILSTSTMASYIGITCSDDYATGTKIEREYMMPLYNCVEVTDTVEIYETNAETQCHTGFEAGNYIQVAYKADRKECIRF